MSLLSICEWIQNTEFSTSPRESTYIFPIIETTRVVALSLSVGLLRAEVNAIVYHMTIYRRIGERENKLVPPLQARLAGWLSLIIWARIIAAGRSIFSMVRSLLFGVMFQHQSFGEIASSLSVHGLSQADTLIRRGSESDRFGGWTLAGIVVFSGTGGASNRFSGIGTSVQAPACSARCIGKPGSAFTSSIWRTCRSQCAETNSSHW